MTEDDVADSTSCIIEINVNTIRAGRCKRGGEIIALVIDRRIVAEQLTALGRLRRSAGNADSPATGDFGDLTDRRAHCAGRRRHHHGVARAWLANIQQSKISGHAIDAGDTQ